MASVNVNRRLYPEYLPNDTYTKTINGHEVTFNDVGYLNPGPAIVALSDWGQGIREFNAEMLLLMDHHRMVAVCFRGHGVNRDPVPDFGYEEHARDVLGLLDWLGVSRFVCLSAGQSGWAALDLAEMAGRQRMIGLVLFEMLMTPPTPQLRQILSNMQTESPQKSRSAVLAYQGIHGASSVYSANDSCYVMMLKEMHMGGTGADTWARAGRSIEQAYATWVSPLHRLEAMSDPPLVHHLYGHPDTKDYESLHKEFRKKHPEWFSYHKKSCKSQFPHLEHQKVACQDTLELIRRAMARKPPGPGAAEVAGER